MASVTCTPQSQSLRHSRAEFWWVLALGHMLPAGEGSSTRRVQAENLGEPGPSQVGKGSEGREASC